ncbi:AAA family ATPase [Photobacterium piscicola]|uniref:AAA family ATPase n=1 Tax=Photobacterium piscicola TaxID=1378299 RepID=UPI002E1720B6|nr:AAA family ATPase [Photobacterium piscicola]
MKLLFGIFNHDIILNEESGITIIIGENGLGKTMMLEAINALFHKDYAFFSRLEFDEFEFFFTNGEIWKLTKLLDSEICSLSISRDSLIKRVKKVTKHKIYQDTDQSSRKIAIRDRKRMIEMEIMEMEMMEVDRNYHFHNERAFYEDRLERELAHRRMMNMRHHKRIILEDDMNVSPPKWFLDSIKNIRVKLIETQRIITAKEIGSDSYVNNLNKCSQELKNMIEIATRKSSIVASELDSTYPNRLVKKLRYGSRDTFEELNTALAKLDDRRKLFSQSGFAVKISDSDLLQIDEKQKNLVNVLKLYIDDSHQKLDPFDELSKKIKLFKGLINKRFKHKNLEIKHDEGLVFRSTVVKNKDGNYVTIPSSKLSSGEQNELILFYKLIFNSNENDMILIDEPELSLHISWQNKFIQDLKEVTSINDVSIVIATHSPDIIDINWDLKVELKGVE